MNAPIGIFTSTPDGRYISANPALARIYGYDSPEDMIESVKDIAAQIYTEPSDREEFMRLLREKGEVWNYECKLRRKGGSIIWTSRNVREVRDSSGKNIHYQGFVTEITGHRQAEEALQKTMSMFERTSRMARIGGWGKNLLTGEDEWSDVTREIHEVGPHFCPTMENSVNFYKQGESRQKIMDVVTKCVETGEPYDVELEFITARGNELWIRTMGQAEFQDGRCVRLFGTFQDITERKQAENALRESEELYRTLVDNLPIAIYRNTPGPDGHFLMANPAFLEIFDIDSEEEVLKKRVTDLYVNPEERKRFSDKVHEKGRITGYKLKLKKIDGTPIWCSVTAYLNAP
jgi:PAS domain S-box-containing protein